MIQKYDVLQIMFLNYEGRVTSWEDYVGLKDEYEINMAIAAVNGARLYSVNYKRNEYKLQIVRGCRQEVILGE